MSDVRDSWRKLQNLFAVRRAARAGRAGEAAAEDFLRKKGFCILARNWRSPADRRDEIDLVCRDGPVLVFVEVKTRSAGARVPGFYTVDRRKRRALRRACRCYLRLLRERPRTHRCDVVEVAGTGPEPPILHFENIALDSKRRRS